VAVAVVFSVLSCHVHSCVAWAVQTCPVIAGDGSRFADDKNVPNVLQQSVWPFRGLIISAGIG
jgi:hypothetical protein